MGVCSRTNGNVLKQEDISKNVLFKITVYNNKFLQTVN